MIQPLQNFEGRHQEELCRKVINDKELENEVLDKECSVFLKILEYKFEPYRKLSGHPSLYICFLKYDH